MMQIANREKGNIFVLRISLCFISVVSGATEQNRPLVACRTGNDNDTNGFTLYRHRVAIDSCF